jgi:hypothetical protein
MSSQQASMGPGSLGGSTGSSSLSLVLKLGLALASVVAYVAIARLAEAVEPIEGVPDTSLWFHYLVGAVFGALVLGPYARASSRALRILVLALASAAIYRLAVWFVTEGPIGYDALVSFMLAGAGAAVLSGLAVAGIGPQPFSARLVVLTLAAGALGGATFDIQVPADTYLLVGHAAWQLLVCIALHAAIRPTPT